SRSRLDCDLVELALDAAVEPFDELGELVRTGGATWVVEPALVRGRVAPERGHEDGPGAARRQLQLGAEATFLLAGALEHAVPPVEADEPLRVAAARLQIEDAADHRDLSGVRSCIATRSVITRPDPSCWSVAVLGLEVAEVRLRADRVLQLAAVVARRHLLAVRLVDRELRRLRARRLLRDDVRREPRAVADAGDRLARAAVADQLDLSFLAGRLDRLLRALDRLRRADHHVDVGMRLQHVLRRLQAG